ncbi:hypothetical protein ACFCZ6_14115 [Streptomyces hydrogenans]|uniref:hypothetical protein n=1 Tax=Streptomyces hydrogenans TaxID=1873719 RepID=UPI0035D63AC4
MTRTPSYDRPLLLGLALLLAGTAVLLRDPDTDPAPRPQNAARPAPTQTAPPATRAPAAGPDHADTTPAGDHTTSTPAPRETATPRPVPSDQPVSGDGPAGDYAIQRLLDRTTPTDLAPTTARHLTRLATRVWLAETTGADRAAWPSYFTGTDLRAPYHDVRVQAAVAHQEGQQPGRVEVRLVWAGADAAGEFRDGRTARVLLERHRNEWKPVR